MKMRLHKGPRGPFRSADLFRVSHANALQRAFRSAFSLTAFLMVSTVAQATTGGSDLCEVLGWDAQNQKVYVLRHNWSEQRAPGSATWSGLPTQTSYSTLRITTFDSPEAFVPRLYAIPERTELLAIVAFTGVGDEEGYETQVPVLLQSSCGDTQDIEWKGYGQ